MASPLPRGPRGGGPPRPREALARVGAAFAGGWAFTWGFVSLAIALATAARMSFDDARTLAYLLAFLVFLAAFCASFAARSVLRCWLVLLGGGACMTALAALLARSAS